MDALAYVNSFVEALTAALPAGTQLLVTADHGMVNVEEKIVLGKENSLMNDVTLVGGEPRARHIYLRDGAIKDAAARWKLELGEKADIYTKESVAHLIGNDVTVDAQERLGDLIVVPRGGLILIDPTREAQEGKMVGHHGGTTSTEVQIPLLTAAL